MDEQYRQFFKAAPGWLTVQDRDLRIIEANEQFQKDFGEWRNRRCHQVYKSDPEQCEDCPVEKTFWDGQHHSTECRVKTLNGREAVVMVYTSPVLNDAGEVASVVKVSTDITQVNRVTTQVRDSQRRYRQLFNEVPCYISIQDAQLNIVDVNRRFEEDFGRHLGCKCYEIYKHRTEECLVCPVQQTFEDGKVHSSEEVVTGRNGEQLNVIVYTTPIFDSMGMITGVMEMSTDITPIRKLQSQLESIGLLISSVSHGIKGLLNGLDGGMYLVNTGMEKGNEQRLKKGWEMVQRNVDRIRGQVLNILYYAKEREPNYEMTSANDLAQEVFGLMQDKAAELQVTLKSVLKEEEAGEAEMDPQAMRSLLVNLMENSLDACRVDKKKTDHCVTLSVKNHADEVEFIISDNGIGMDRETRDKAFTLFFSSKGAKGTGLGLFIADKIARAHGGRIELASELDKGTRFMIFIPKKRIIDPAPNQTQ